MSRPTKRSTNVRVETFRRWLGIFSISRILRWSVYLFLAVWLYRNWHNDIPTSTLLQQYSYPDSRLTTIDGMDVHYRVSGDGKETILLLHDSGNSLHTWAGWTDTLSKKYRVVSVDLPGFGLTGPHPQGSYSAFMYAGFLDKFVDTLKLNKFTLAGNGLGAQIAWFYAAEYSENLNKLILLNAPGFETKSPPLVMRFASTPVVNSALWKVTPRDAMELMLENVYADNTRVNEKLVQRHLELFLRPGNRKAFTDRAQVRDNRPPVDLIDNITTPTLILWGAEDTYISPEFAYEFHRRIRGAFLKIYQNTGHWPQEENPVQSVQDVMAFLEGRF